MAPRSMTAVKELLPSILTRLAHDTGYASVLKPIWQNTVGDYIGRNTTPVALEGTTLVVRATNSAWAAELEKREDELLPLLAQHLGTGIVTKLAFRVTT